MSLFRSTLLVLLVLQFAPVQAVAADGNNVDPFEAINRPIFEFNNGLDTLVIRPVAKGYHFVMPDVAERGVNNFFSNLYDIHSALNAVLQGRFAGAAQGSGRFLLNSTLGVAGLFDVATPMGLEPYRTDFGHTLAIWGVPAGPYVMLPLLGPRTLRDGTGTIVDTFTSVQAYLDNVALRNSLYGLELVDARARLLQADELLSGDRYIFVRDAYLQQRNALVNDGEVPDDFSDFGDDGWDEEF